jgi:hypothetical protein
MSLPPWLEIHCRNFPTSRMSDLETELLLLLANAGFAIAVDDTIIPTAAIAIIANVVVFVIVFDVFIML